MKYLCSLWEKYENVIAVELLNEPPLGGLPNLCYALSIWRRVDPLPFWEKRASFWRSRFLLGLNANFFLVRWAFSNAHSEKVFAKLKRQVHSYSRNTPFSSFPSIFQSPPKPRNNFTNRPKPKKSPGSKSFHRNLHHVTSPKHVFFSLNLHWLWVHPVFSHLRIASSGMSWRNWLRSPSNVPLPLPTSEVLLRAQNVPW